MDGAWLAALGPAVAAALMLGLACVLLWLDAASQPVRAFVAFLVLRAGILASGLSARAFDPASATSQALAESVVYYEIGIAVALGWFLMSYPRRRGLLRFRGGGLALLAMGAALSLFNAWDPCLIVCNEPAPRLGRLSIVTVGVPLAAGVGAIVLFRDIARAPASLARTSAVLLAAGFFLEASIGAARAAAFVTLFPDRYTTWPYLATAGPPLAVFVLAFAALMALFRILPRPAGSIAALSMLGVVVSAFATLRATETATFVLGLLRLGLPLLAVYALGRYRLFDLDVKVRLAARRATIGAIFAGVFFVVTEGTAYALGSMFGMFAGILAVGALVPLMGPLRRAAERVAQLLPGDDSPARDLPIEKGRQIYHDFAIQAWSDGKMAREERAFLNELRDRLALSAEDALRLESDAAKGNLLE